MTRIATTDRARFLLEAAAQCYANAQREGMPLEVKATWLQDSETFVDLALRAMREAIRTTQKSSAPERRPLDCRVMPLVETENGNDGLQEHV